MILESDEGYKDREFTEDQYKLVMAIKRGEGSLYNRFQEYWKERCWNPEYLSDFDRWCVLSSYAKDMFNKEDWAYINEYMKNLFILGKTISSREMADIYLQTIQLMTMRYKIR